MQKIRGARPALGVQWARSPRTVYRRTGFLRRWTPVDLPAGRYLDWSVDGEAIGDWFATNDDPRFETSWLNEDDHDVEMIEASLLALLDEGGTLRRSDVRFPDGRVALLFCAQCGDLGCGAVSAEVRFSDDAVAWRDIAYQDGATGELRATPSPRTVIFDRDQYEATIRQLLNDWTDLA